MTKRRRQNNKHSNGKITVEMVRNAHFKRITGQKLTEIEQKICEKYYFDDDKIITRVRFEPISREENAKRRKQGLPPRVLKQNERCP